MSKASIIEKICIMGEVRVVSPLAISTGQSDGVIDSMIMRNGNGQPMIPGTSIAGVLRHVIRANYNSENAELVLRDGVAIDGITGTAIQGGKYDYEAVDRGATGKIQIEITIRQQWQEQRQDIQEIAKDIANQLACGINLGGHTSKGLGQISCSNVKAYFYDFAQPTALNAWLIGNNPPAVYKAVPKAVLSPNTFRMEIDFAIKGALLIGTEEDIFAKNEENKRNKIMLKSGTDYVIPGTSVKGVIRKQAEYICRHAGCYSQDFLNNLMGYTDKTGKKSRKSRLHTQEVYLKQGVKACAQTHVRIDRFTGGHMDSGLFTDQPIWQEKPNTKVMTMSMSVEDCSQAEAGLMLLLLKDIWTGQVAFGGDKAAGSGVLQGLEARISYNKQNMKLKQEKNKIAAAPETQCLLEELVGEFVRAGEA